MRYKVVLLPALILFVISSYLGCLSSILLDPGINTTVVTTALGLCGGGIVLVLGWFLLLCPSIISRLHKRFGSRGEDSGQEKPNFDPEKCRITLINHTFRSLSKPRLSFAGLVSSSLVISGLFTLAWVGQLTWNDIVVWNKGIIEIFFGSRTGENISLGIGIKVIHYLLLGLTLCFSGLATFLHGRLRGFVNSLKDQIFELERRNDELDEQLEELLDRIEMLEKQPQKRE